MDWLSQNQAGIYCSQGIVSFVSSQGEKVEVVGRSQRNLLWVVKPSKLIKGLPIYVLKLNKPEPIEERDEPDWLNKYQDIFLEELIDLPPEREPIYEIELILGA